MDTLTPLTVALMISMAWAGGTYAVFQAVGQALKGDARASLSLWLQGDLESTWTQQFCRWFDVVFGQKHLGWNCFIRSSLASIFFVLLIYFLMGPILGVLKLRLNDDTSLGQVLLLGMVLNLIPDYLSLYETRWLLQRFERVKGFWANLLLLVIDALVSGLIIGIAIALYKWVMGVETGFGHTVGAFDITAIFFYSSFLTSLFAWLYCLSTWFSKLFYRTWVFKLFDLKDNPENALALVSATLVLVASFGVTVSAAPTVKDNPEALSVKTLSAFDRLLCDWFADTCTNIALLSEDDLEKMAVLMQGCRGGEIALCSDVSWRQFTAKQYETAHELWQLSCEGGEALDCNNLGVLYQAGQGVEQDYAKATLLYQQACDGGAALGCSNLGGLYETGQGVEQDYSKAISLYQQACEGGVFMGCNNLGVLYQAGQGVEQDYAKALSLYQQACDGGVSMGCHNLGGLYETGQGDEQDYSKAISLYQQACEGGAAVGCNNLGVLYETGQGVAQDYSKALSLYQQACNGGHAFACNYLGVQYVKGYGLKQDFDQAFSLFQQACNRGYASACKYDAGWLNRVKERRANLTK